MVVRNVCAPVAHLTPLCHCHIRCMARYKLNKHTLFVTLRLFKSNCLGPLLLAFDAGAAVIVQTLWPDELAARITLEVFLLAGPDLGGGATGHCECQFVIQVLISQRGINSALRSADGSRRFVAYTKRDTVT